jgi:multiple sugar transport system permease protein
MSIVDPVQAEPVAEEAAVAKRVRRPGKKPTPANKGQARRAFYLIAPTIALLALVVGYPIVKAIYQSLLTDPGLNKVTGIFDQGGAWNGITNYKHWLLEQCPTTGGIGHCPTGTLGSQFYGSLLVTVGFTVVTVAFETAIGMGFALMMNRAFRGRAIVRAAILIPWAIPTAVTTKLWVVVFDPQGILNKVLGTHIAWTSSMWPARSAVVIADVWKTTPFIALLILAGLQGISADVYEASRIDGTNPWQRFWRITLPLVKPALAVAVIFRTLDVLRIFDLPYILTGGANGTSTLSILVVHQLNSGINSASALSTITFIFIFAIAFGLVKLFNANILGAQAAKVK